ncbi:solute:sodium symporter family transporter [Clostridium sp.]|uniref:solute:sodium symporter family transporter n=1 Tax=Clostridium sp. TaxID=1506 RepID=UPI003D6C99EB
MQNLTIVSFIFFTGLVGLITYLKLKGNNKRNQSKDAYFLGGRSLTGGVIGASLLLTNLSAANFVGMSGQSYSGNMSNMAYEVTSGLVLVVVAMYLVPRYLKQGITTVPDFLEDRYDSGVKKSISILFLLCYVLNLLPTTLYSGAIALSQIFNLESTFGISYQMSIWITVWSIGIIGYVYAVIGGLKAIAVSDLYNGIGLAVSGLLVPFFGLLYLGKGSFSQGLSYMVSTAPEKLNAVGGANDPVPFGAAMTGLLLVNLYYWGTDQSIIQRALAAKNLKEGQKGVILAGLLKVMTPLIVIIPGIIAFQIFGGGAVNPDLMYSKLVNAVMPKYLTGFFAAAMFGAVLSTFTGVLNSASTLFALNVYGPIFGKGKSDKELVSKAKSFGLIIAGVSMIIAPFIMYAPQGLFQYLQIVNGFFNVPIFTIVFIGYVTKRVPAIAAKVSLVFFVGTYAILQLVIKPDLNFLYQLAILFVLSSALMLIIGKIKPRETDYVMEIRNVVDIEPWEHRHVAGGVVVFLMISMYILFSKLGVASVNGITIYTFGYMLIVAIIITLAVIFIKRKDSEKIKKNEAKAA